MMRQIRTVEPAYCPDPLREYSDSLSAQVAPWSRPGISSNVLLRQPGVVAGATLAGGRRRRHRTQLNAIRRGNNFSFWPPTQMSQRGRR